MSPYVPGELHLNSSWLWGLESGSHHVCWLGTQWSRESWHACGFIRKVPAFSALCKNGFVQAAVFLSPKGSPPGHGEQTTGGDRFVLLCSFWVCFYLTKTDSPRELAGRQKVTFIHYTFTLPQVRIIDQEKKVVFMPCPSPEARWTKNQLVISIE